MNARQLSLVGSALATALLAGPAPAAAGPSAGFVDVQFAKGQVGCALGLLLVTTDDLCPHGSRNGSNISFEVPAGTDRAVVEMRWVRPTVLHGTTLSLSAPATIEGARPQRVEGPCILRLEVPSAAPGGAAAGADIWASAGAARDSRLVFEQPFELAVSSFVDRAVPPGYSAFGRC